jgi:hypothetical protein
MIIVNNIYKLKYRSFLVVILISLSLFTTLIESSIFSHSPQNIQLSNLAISILLLFLLISKTLTGQLAIIFSLSFISKSLMFSSSLITGTCWIFPKLTGCHFAWILAIPFLASHSNINSWFFLILTIGTPTSYPLIFLKTTGNTGLKSPFKSCSDIIFKS